MAYNVSSAFREQLYSGESEFRAILTIGGTIIDNDQIASISISSPIIDDSKQVFYVGTFISQKITIKFKTMEGINVNSGDRVELSIGQYVNNQWEDVPIGKFLIDDLAEDYYEKCEINCLDYAVLFKPNIDYSECFVDGKATIKMILEQICTAVGVELGDYPTTNDEVEVGTYDSTVSGKQWISYIAELKGCNAKMDRLGRLTLQPLKQSSNVPINALESASWETKENFNVTQVTFFDAIRNYTFGSDDGDTLFIRQDNPFITDANVVQNIYDTICVDKYSASGKSFDLEDVDAHPMQVKTIYGETSQETYSGKNLMDLTTNSTSGGVTVVADYNSARVTSSSTVTDNKIDVGSAVLSAGTYTMMLERLSGNDVLSGWIYYKGSWDRPTTTSLGLPSGSSKASLTFTISGQKTICWGLYSPSGRTYSGSNFRVSIVSGSTADFNFEKYVGGIPSPNPDYPQDVNTVKGNNKLKIVGKNIFNPSNFIPKNNVSITNDGVMSSAGMVSTPWTYANAQYYTHLKQGDYTLSAFFSTVDTNQYSRLHIINTNDTLLDTSDIFKNKSKFIYHFHLNDDKDVGIMFKLDNGVCEFQITEGTEETDFEQYQERIQPIDLPVENLFDKDNATSGKRLYYYQGEVSLIDDANYCVSDYIPVEANTKYSVNYTMSAYTRMIYYNSNKNAITANESNSTFTTHSTCAYIRLSVALTNLDTAQLEIGSKANSFTPYGTTPIELNKIGTYQDYIYKENDKWYLHKEIGKVVLSSCNWVQETTSNSRRYGAENIKNIVKKPPNNPTTMDLLSNIYVKNNASWSWNTTSGKGICIQTNGAIIIYDDSYTASTDLSNFTTMLSNTNAILEYPLATPTNTKITYQPLIDQLNALQNAGLFEGTNHITIDTLNEVPTIDIDYYKNSHFNLWSLKTHNFGDFTLDAWDNIDYDLDGEHYLTLNNNTIAYEMSIMSDVDTKIPNKQQTATTNIIGGDDKTNLKIIKTNVDNLNASVNILSKQQTDTQTNITQLQLDVNGINQTVEHIENTEIGGLQSEISSVQQTMNTITNMFQISGGINSIRNSAFLLKDEVWEFTDNGTNPYHTDLGNSYNSTLSGTTVSVAEIKLRSTKVKSTSDNITDLKTDGTKYTFNFYHKQDNYMTTTIKMYSTENNTIKAFNDIVITGQQQFKNYEVSFVPTYTNYTIEIIVTSTASVGYAYISDMILNAGDKQSWQPASDEIYSTTLQMSRLGLQVYSVGDGTITLLGSDGMSTYETSDGKTFGRLVSIRTINGDRVKNVTTQSIKLVLDATKTEEELATENKWVETVINIGGSRYKVEYEESGE